MAVRFLVIQFLQTVWLLSVHFREVLVKMMLNRQKNCFFYLEILKNAISRFSYCFVFGVYRIIVWIITGNFWDMNIYYSYNARRFLARSKIYSGILRCHPCERCKAVTHFIILNVCAWIWMCFTYVSLKMRTPIC